MGENRPTPRHDRRTKCAHRHGAEGVGSGRKSQKVVKCGGRSVRQVWYNWSDTASLVARRRLAQMCDGQDPQEAGGTIGVVTITSGPRSWADEPFRRRDKIKTPLTQPVHVGGLRTSTRSTAKLSSRSAGVLWPVGRLECRSLAGRRAQRRHAGTVGESYKRWALRIRSSKRFRVRMCAFAVPAEVPTQ